MIRAMSSVSVLWIKPVPPPRFSQALTQSGNLINMPPDQSISGDIYLLLQIVHKRGFFIQLLPVAEGLIDQEAHVHLVVPDVDDHGFIPIFHRPAAV